MDAELESLLEKAEEGRGLSADEAVWILLHMTPRLWPEVFECARRLTDQVFQRRLHFFAPLYFSNFCVNNCRYCGFRRDSRWIRRRVLDCAEFLREAEYLWSQGHRSLLLVAGEHPFYAGVEQIAEYARALAAEGLHFSLMTEIAPLAGADYACLRSAGVRRCVLFQETYDREVYRRVHEGPKKDFEWRFGAMARALDAGVESVGLGILLGLADPLRDLRGLIEHAGEIHRLFGRFPATVSFPRLRPAPGTASMENTADVPDEQFLKIIAVTRLALPHSGIVLSTREDAQLRTSLLRQGTGVTHMSAGSCTGPGGYAVCPEEAGAQFDILDRRPLKEVMEEAARLGYEPELGVSGFGI